MRLKPRIKLHRCVDCGYWEPALTYFGEPTGQGGCRFALARNRKEDKLRECKKYQESKNMGVEIAVEPKEAKQLESLIYFWNDSLVELLMSPSTIYWWSRPLRA